MPEPDDPADVAADDQLLDDLIAGATPPTHDQAAQLIATWRREAAHVSDPWIYRRLADERLMDDVPAAGGRDPATTMLPATVRYGGAEDWVRPEPTALTAGQQDHSDPWAFAGADADPPGAP